MILFTSNMDNGVFCADPLFADTLGHLSEQSPAIGRGVASLEIDGTIYQAPATDFDGNHDLQQSIRLWTSVPMNRIMQ